MSLKKPKAQTLNTRFEGARGGWLDHLQDSAPDLKLLTIYCGVMTPA